MVDLLGARRIGKILILYFNVLKYNIINLSGSGWLWTGVSRARWFGLMGPGLLGEICPI